MNFEFYIIIISLIVFILISIRFVYGSKLSYGQLKGIQGEQKVSNMLDKENVVHFTDVLLELGRTSTQIDHLVVFPNKTVIVIETKNKDGTIYGNYNDQQWTQTFPKTHYTFYNPIKQNEGHIRFLERFCRQNHLKGYQFINLVVFASDRCDIRNTPDNVIHYKDLPRIVRKFKRKKLFNASHNFSKAIRKNNQSKNKRKLKKHIDFIREAKRHHK